MPNLLTFILICLIIRRKEGENMRNFDYSDLASRLWDSENVNIDSATLGSMLELSAAFESYNIGTSFH